MKLNRFDTGAYCFLVVFDPEKEEVCLGTIDPGSEKLDELILVPKSTLAGLLATEQRVPTSSVPARKNIDGIQATRETLSASAQIRQSIAMGQDVPVSMPISSEESVVVPVLQASNQAKAAQAKPRREYRDDDLLNRSEAAEYLGVSEKTLAIWKSTGRYNLPFIKLGRLIRYRKFELDEFVEGFRRGGGRDPRRKK